MHPANIVVTKRQDIEGEEYFDYLLTDFGGGGYVGNHSFVGSRYGYYLAPEVENGKSATPEVDVFSLGRIGRTLVSLRRNISAEKDSMDWKNVPKDLKKILEDCTTDNPLERPKTSPLVSRLDDLYVPDLMKNETDAWTEWVSVLSDLTVIETDAVVGGDVTCAEAEVDEILRRFNVTLTP